MHGEPVTIEGTELLARCVQHETDHLDGILFIDRLDRAQRKAALKAIREAEWSGETAPAGQAVAARHCTAGRSEPPVRLVFAGTPAGRRPGAATRCSASRHEVVAVLTRPTRRPAGAGARSRRPVAAAGRARPASRCSSPRKAARPGLPGRAAARAGAGLLPGGRLRRLVPRTALDVPPHGWVNLHFSLLPAWRGAAPVQHAILHGDDVTGATLFLLEEGLDTGPVFGGDDRADPARATPAATCSTGSPVAGAGLLVATLDGSRAASSSAGRSRPTASASPQAHRRRRPGRLDGAGARTSTGWSAPAPRRPAPGRRCAATRLGLGPVEPRRAPTDARARARSASAVARCWSAPATASRAARRGAPGRAAADGGGRLGPRRPRPRRRDAGVTGPPAARPRQARPRRAQARGRTCPARVAFDLLRAVDERDAYANLTLPALLRERGLDGRDAAFATELAYGTLRGQGTLRRGAGRLRRPAAGPGRPAGARPAAARRPPAARRCGSRRTPRSARRSSWPARWPARAAARSSTRCCAGSAAHDLAAWLAEVAPADDADPVGHLAVVALRTRAGSSRRCATRSAASLDARPAALLAADNVPPQVTLVARPGRATVAELADGAAPGPAAGRRTPRVLAGGDPGGIARGARRPGRGPGRGQPAGRAGPGRGRPSRAPTRAGWTCAPGRAARRRCSARSRPARGAALLAAEVAPHRAGLVAPARSA